MELNENSIKNLIFNNKTYYLSNMRLIGIGKVGCLIE